MADSGVPDSWVLDVIDPAREWAYRRALCREADAAGYWRGWEEGRRLLLEELAAAQAAACGPARAVLADPEWRVLEDQRWGALPAGWIEPPRREGEHPVDWRRRVGESRRRARVRYPRPGDYAGGPVPQW